MGCGTAIGISLCFAHMVSHGLCKCWRAELSPIWLPLSVWLETPMCQWHRGTSAPCLLKTHPRAKYKLHHAEGRSYRQFCGPLPVWLEAPMYQGHHGIFAPCLLKYQLKTNSPELYIISSPPIRNIASIFLRTRTCHLIALRQCTRSWPGSKAGPPLGHIAHLHVIFMYI